MRAGMPDMRRIRLNQAAASPRDEFHTLWDTVDAELRLHEPFPNGAHVYCRCDKLQHEGQHVRPLARRPLRPAVGVDPDGYDRYDNRPDTIDIPRMSLPPARYDGPTGVPITFMDRNNPMRWRVTRFRLGADGRPLTIDARETFQRIIIQAR